MTNHYHLLIETPDANFEPLGLGLALYTAGKTAWSVQVIICLIWIHCRKVMEIPNKIASI